MSIISGEEFLEAANDEKIDVINKYIEQNKNSLEALNIQDNEGRTALYIVTVRNNIACVEALIRAGADPNIAQFYEDYTPLTIACARGSLEVVKLLLAGKAELNKPSKFNYSPAYWAVCNDDNDELLTFLINSGADVTSDQSHNIMNIAMARAHSKCIGVLIANGVEIRSEDKDIFSSKYIFLKNARPSQRRYLFYKLIDKLHNYDRAKVFIESYEVVKIAQNGSYNEALNLAMERQSVDMSVGLSALIQYLDKKEDVTLQFLISCCTSLSEYSPFKVSVKKILENKFNLFVGRDVESQDYTTNLFLISSALAKCSLDPNEKANWQREADIRFALLSGSNYWDRNIIENIEPSYCTLLRLAEQIKLLQQRVNDAESNNCTSNLPKLGLRH